MTRFVFSMEKNFGELQQLLPPEAKYRKLFTIKDHDGDQWNVIAYSPDPLLKPVGKEFLAMLHTKIFPCDVQKGE